MKLLGITIWQRVLLLTAYLAILVDRQPLAACRSDAVCARVITLILSAEVNLLQMDIRIAGCTLNLAESRTTSRAFIFIVHATRAILACSEPVPLCSSTPLTSFLTSPFLC